MANEEYQMSTNKGGFSTTPRCQTYNDVIAVQRIKQKVRC